MLLLANQCDSHVVIAIDSHLKCVNDELQETVYVFVMSVTPKVTSKFFHSLAEQHLEVMTGITYIHDGSYHNKHGWLLNP
jgi:pentose-5-phosphate-3-epimerase